jgi:hypothetical protein
VSSWVVLRGGLEDCVEETVCVVDAAEGGEVVVFVCVVFGVFVVLSGEGDDCGGGGGEWCWEFGDVVFEHGDVFVDSGLLGEGWHCRLEAVVGFLIVAFL